MSETVVEEAKAVNIRVLTFSDVIEAGKQLTNVTFNEPNEDSVYMFCYTSGTTGDPKAVKLTHKNIISASTAGLID